VDHCQQNGRGYQEMGDKTESAAYCWLSLVHEAAGDGKQDALLASFMPDASTIC